MKYEILYNDEWYEVTKAGYDKAEGLTDRRITSKPRKRKSSVAFKGVYWNGKRWVARFEGKYLGKFIKQLDAAQAYKEAAETKYGEGAAEL